MPNYTLKKPDGSNKITNDPDTYARRATRISQTHNTIEGIEYESLLALHHHAVLAWGYGDKDQYDALKELLNSYDLTLLGDGNVPALTKTATVWENVTLKYVNEINNPSTTHIAYYDTSANEPSAESDFEGTEVASGDYEDMGSINLNGLISSNPGAGNYFYHKHTFISTIPVADVNRIRIRIYCYCQDSSNYDEDGVLLYVWNGTGWQLIGETTNLDNNWICFSSHDQAIAQSFVDPVDGYIRVLLKSRNQMVTGDNIVLNTWYVDVELNPGLSKEVELSNTPVLTSGDVTSITNTTDSTTLKLGPEYTISDNIVDLGGAYATLNGAEKFVGGNILNVGTKDLCISCWAKRDGIPAGSEMLVMKSSAAYGYALQINSSGQLIASIDDDIGGYIGTSGGDSICDNEWHHCAVVCDRSGNMQTYIDGATYGAAVDITGNNGDLDVANDFTIGAGSFLDTWYLEGSMCDFRIYIATGDVWSASNVLEQVTSPRDITVGGSLTSSYSFNDDYFELVLTDTTGSNDLVLTGGTTDNYGLHSRTESVDGGDEVVIQYDRLFEGRLLSIIERWLNGDPASNRLRSLDLVYETLSLERKDS